MYAISNSNRIYSLIFLCLCAAFFLAPSVNAAQNPWPEIWDDFNDLKRQVDADYQRMTNRPPNTTITPSSSAPTISKNPSGGLSASSNNILRNMGHPSTFNSTSNYSLNSAKNALKSCVRSPSCAGRTLGGGAIIYDGIKAWKDVYDLTLGDDDTVHKNSPENPVDYPPAPDDETGYIVVVASGYYTDASMPADSYVVASTERNNRDYNLTCTQTRNSLPFYSFRPHALGAQNGGHCFYTPDLGHETPIPTAPVSLPELDQMIDDGYEPAVSDAPIVITGGGSPESITLSTPAPVQLPSTTTTNTNSSGTTTTVTDKTITYTVVNNNSPSPTINSSTTTNTITYDSNSNVVDTSTSTTTETGVQHDVPPRVPAPPAANSPVELDFELPSFCSWASIVCDWIGWTKEPLGEEEPDLSQLITVFEPDEDEFDLGIGSGSCPAPMMLNLGIINKTVEVKYDPFCDFLEMIRPFVLAAAYLFAAYLYIGVLRRG